MGRLSSAVSRLLGRTSSTPRGVADLRPAAPGGPVVQYAVEVDGEPDPGEVVWGWVPYEDDPSQGKDRPVLLLAHHDSVWFGLMLSSQDHSRDPAREARHGRHWMDVGSGAWDSQGRPSEVRLDRLLRLDGASIRREGAALPKPVFDRVVARARQFHDLG
ncbi:type II toxin-antitoxin system PemK/MazF family toxin [Nocardioides jishulii]|uniref:type II toxin-antitoxin system PemK/MazF family toxin n=1 Tax=Nocardioides jishulii TaxID=2575440 RepID=UPI001EEFB3C1|nr:type II toxin-antitoxin system PemK/MazF family toxin [Nocardioides jishulii]